jgi:hypothetical protein
LLASRHILAMFASAEIPIQSAHPQPCDSCSYARKTVLRANRGNPGSAIAHRNRAQLMERVAE